MKRMGVLGWTVAMSLGLVAPTAGVPRPVAAAPSAPIPLPNLAAPPPSTLPETANQRQLRYAAREAVSPAKAEFRGGDSVAIYISGGAVALVLLVVLVVVLL